MLVFDERLFLITFSEKILLLTGLQRLPFILTKKEFLKARCHIQFQIAAALDTHWNIVNDNLGSFSETTKREIFVLKIVLFLFL